MGMSRHLKPKITTCGKYWYVQIGNLIICFLRWETAVQVANGHLILCKFESLYV